MLIPLLLSAVAAAAPALDVQIVHQGPDVIWGFDFLPDGRVLLTERWGRLLRRDRAGGKAEPVRGCARAWARGQGGLLDVRAHPGFAANRWVYLTWSEPSAGGATTALGRGRLEGGELKGFERLFAAAEPGARGEHFGSRLEFIGEHLFM